MIEDNDCVFCKILKGEIKSDIVYSDDNFFGILDINPKAEGHTLIVSKKHFKNILDVPSSLGGELLDAVKKVGLNLIKEKKGSGFNLVSNCGSEAGQIVHHFHVHVIPRRKGDGLRIG